MKKIELLAPAGDQESLIAAVQNGADAIYLGGTLFSARAFAKNFDDDQLQWAIQYAHLYGVKIYVTVNTLFKDTEIETLVSYIDKLYQFQVDALIIQDIGLFDIVRTLYPDFEIHMSTQSSIMNLYGVDYFEKCGAARVVLARENTLEEIQHICQKTSIDIEVFVHGAMCVCYSGQCLMSSMIGKRSGNRGQCAQPCRLPYRLLKDNQVLPEKYPFLLSPKDMMTIEHVGSLIEAGVSSLKIEGRMKRPEYVASVTRAYRQAIDAYYARQKVDLEPLIHDMKSMFNRNYTLGYLKHDTHLVDGDYSGHKGTLVGHVLYYHKKHKRVGIQLTDTLCQGDSIVFEHIDKGRPVNKMYLQKKLVHTAHAQDIIEIEFDQYVSQGNVRKTLDKKVVESLQQTYQTSQRKIPVTMNFDAQLNHKAQLTLTTPNASVTVQSDCDVEYARKTPLDRQRIFQQLSKLGSTPFEAKDIQISSDDNISMPIKNLNEMRRKATDDLSQKLSSQKIHHRQSLTKLPVLKRQNPSQHQDVYIVVYSLEQLQIVVDYSFDIIVYPYQKDIDEAFDLCQKHHKKMIMMTSPVMKDNEIQDILSSHIYQSIDTILVNDYGSYHAFRDKNVIAGSGLNIYNSYAANYYSHPFVTSLEMSANEIEHLRIDPSQCIVQIFGKTENMISDYCPISQYYFGYQNKHCHMCQQGQFALMDRKKEVFHIMVDEQCRMHLLNAHTLYYEKFQNLSVGGIMIRFTDEDQKTVKWIMDDFVNVIFQHQKSILREKIKITSSYFKEI